MLPHTALINTPSEGIPAPVSLTQPSNDKPKPVPRVPLSASRAAAEGQLKPCVGKTVQEVVLLLGLEDAERHWSDEPPGILRGARYYASDGGTVTLIPAVGEPMYGKFDDSGEWDYKMFLGCRVGWVQYDLNDDRLDVGPAGLVQWRP
jgi:hypothetical protein